MKEILFKSSFFGDVKINLSEAINNKPVLITEEINKTDVEQIQKLIDKGLKDQKSDIKTQISDIVKKELGSRATEQLIVTISTNCIVQLYKALWSRRGFWKSAISNKPN